MYVVVKIQLWQMKVRFINTRGFSVQHRKEPLVLSIGIVCIKTDCWTHWSHIRFRIWLTSSMLYQEVFTISFMVMRNLSGRCEGHIIWASIQRPHKRARPRDSDAISLFHRPYPGHLFPAMLWGKLWEMFVAVFAFLVSSLSQTS